jgi:hypothetical protein
MKISESQLMKEWPRLETKARQAKFFFETLRRLARKITNDPEVFTAYVAAFLCVFRSITDFIENNDQSFFRKWEHKNDRRGYLELLRDFRDDDVHLLRKKGKKEKGRSEITPKPEATDLIRLAQQSQITAIGGVFGTPPPQLYGYTYAFSRKGQNWLVIDMCEEGLKLVDTLLPDFQHRLKS